MSEPKMMHQGAHPNPAAEDLDPGVRRTVAWLRALGFVTTDSGDGVSKAEAIAEGEAMEFPHVVMVSTPEALHQDATMLLVRLQEASVDPDAFQIEATYDPFRGSAIILLSGVNDSMLPKATSVPVSRDAFDLPWHEAYEPQPMPTGARTPRDE